MSLAVLHHVNTMVEMMSLGYVHTLSVLNTHKPVFVLEDDGQDL